MNIAFRHGIVSLLVVFTAVLASGFFKDPEWLLQARFPAWHPPILVFSLGWALYYLAVMVNLRRAEMRTRDGRIGVGLLVGQLVMIVAWSALFFGWHRTGWALIPLTLAACFAGYGLFQGARRQGSIHLWELVTTGWLILFWVWAVVLWTINGGI